MVYKCRYYLESAVCILFLAHEFDQTFLLEVGQVVTLRYVQVPVAENELAVGLLDVAEALEEVGRAGCESDVVHLRGVSFGGVCFILHDTNLHSQGAEVNRFL